MRWEDERYIRSYTRDTIAWKMLPWQSKCLLQLLFRKVDRVGLLDVGEYGTEGIAVIVELPIDVVEAGLQKLLDKKMVQWTGENQDVLFIPNFLSAQEAHTSDAQRKRDQRERATARARLQALGLQSDNESRTVTISPKTDDSVTNSHCESLRAEPSRTEDQKNTHACARVGPTEAGNQEMDLLREWEKAGLPGSPGMWTLAAELRKLPERQRMTAAEVMRHFKRLTGAWAQQGIHTRPVVDNVIKNLPFLVQIQLGELTPETMGKKTAGPPEPQRKKYQDAEDYAAQQRRAAEAGE